MIPLLYLLYYLLVKAVGKVVPVFGTRLSRRVHRRAADEVARDVELAAIETIHDEQPPAGVRFALRFRGPTNAHAEITGCDLRIGATRRGKTLHRVHWSDDVGPPPADVELESITPAGDGRVSFECVLPDGWLADERTIWVDGSIGLRTARVVRRNRIALGGATYAFSDRSVTLD
ncbi:hypothetical protein [Halalkalicoccus ordinarius]|uniref:hypothetical protein n=1 Tax=Halalkalicoccus ordinarius TaxID=3116651 RepID=UPI00300F2489